MMNARSLTPLLLAASLTSMCGGSSPPAVPDSAAAPTPPPAATQESTMPTHAIVQAAAIASGDPEYAMWVEDPTQYVTRPSDKAPALTAHALHFVMPMDMPHPMSFYVAVRDGKGVVTSTTPSGVAQVVAAEPALTAETVPATVFELLRDHGKRQEFVSGTATRAGDGWAVSLELTNNGVPAHWDVTLNGAASDVKERVP